MICTVSGWACSGAEKALPNTGITTDDHQSDDGTACRKDELTKGDKRLPSKLFGTAARGSGAAKSCPSAMAAASAVSTTVAGNGWLPRTGGGSTGGGSTGGGSTGGGSTGGGSTGGGSTGGGSTGGGSTGGGSTGGVIRGSPITPKLVSVLLVAPVVSVATTVSVYAPGTGGAITSRQWPSAATICPVCHARPPKLPSGRR